MNNLPTRDPSTFAKTDFQTRQRKAKKNSRRLFAGFCLMMLLTAFLYGGVVYLFIVVIGFGFPLACGALVASLCMFVIADGYYMKRKAMIERGAVGLSERMGGKKLVNPQNFYDQQLQNIVEEMSVASGLKTPHLLIARENQTINAFVTCDDDGENFALTVTQGAIRYLNREELQALVAHEFGHIKNGDVLANLQLSATIYGFFMLSDYVAPESSGYSADDRTKNMFGRNDSVSDNSPFGDLGILVWFITSVMIFCGRLLQASFSRERERLADSHAVEYTRNGSALVSVFKKIMALQQDGVPVPRTKRDQAHFHFFDYTMNWATHPPLEERIKTYGYMPSDIDIESTLHQMKNPALDPYRQAQGVSGTVDPNQVNRVDTAKEAFDTFLPIMILHQYQQALDVNPELKTTIAVNHLLAHFVYHGEVSVFELKSQFKLDDRRVSGIKASMEELETQHNSIHLRLFFQALDATRELTSKQKSQIFKLVNVIIKADKEMTWHEACMVLCMRVAYSEKVVGTDSILQHQEDIAFLIQVMANISSEFENKQRGNYGLLVDRILPNIKAEFTPMMLDTPTIEKLTKTILNLREIKPVFLKDLVQAVEENMYLDNRASIQQVDMLETLKRVLT